MSICKIMTVLLFYLCYINLEIDSCVTLYIGRTRETPFNPPEL